SSNKGPRSRSVRRSGVLAVAVLNAGGFPTPILQARDLPDRSNSFVKESFGSTFDLVLYILNSAHNLWYGASSRPRWFGFYVVTDAFRMNPLRKPKTADVGVISKVLRILEAIESSPSALHLKDICAQTRINKTTAYRFVAHLQREGYLCRD